MCYLHSERLQSIQVLHHKSVLSVRLDPLYSHPPSVRHNPSRGFFSLQRQLRSGRDVIAKDNLLAGGSKKQNKEHRKNDILNQKQKLKR